MKQNIIRRRYDLPLVDSPGKMVRAEIELDKDTEKVRGILLTANRDNQLYHRGTVQITLGGKEVFPDMYAAKLLMSGLGVAPKDRYLPTDLSPGNGILKVAYSDMENPIQGFATYTVSVYLELETHSHAEG